MHWFNEHRCPGHCDDVPPAEFEAAFYAAERLAKKLAAEETRRVESVRSLTFGAYLTSQWLPAKKLHLATTTTYGGYERNVVRHVLPTLGRTGLRRLLTADRIAL